MNDIENLDLERLKNAYKDLCTKYKKLLSIEQQFEDMSVLTKALRNNEYNYSVSPKNESKFTLDAEKSLISYLLENRPNIFKDEYFMEGPTGTFNGQNIIASVYRLEFSYIIEGTVEAQQDEYVNYIGNMLALEYDEIVRKLDEKGKIMCPYVPLSLVRAIDSESFQPKIGFKARYGTINKDA